MWSRDAEAFLGDIGEGFALFAGGGAKAAEFMAWQRGRRRSKRASPPGGRALPAL